MTRAGRNRRDVPIVAIGAGDLRAAGRVEARTRDRTGEDRALTRATLPASMLADDVAPAGLPSHAALRIGEVYACVRVLVDAASSLPLHTTSTPSCPPRPASARFGRTRTCRSSRLPSPAARAPRGVARPRPADAREARHTCASYLIAAGLNAKQVQTYVGHSGVRTTFNVYGHLLDGDAAHAAALDAYLDAPARHSRESRQPNTGGL